VKSFVTHCELLYIQYTAVCQQQETEYRAYQNLCIMGIECLSGVAAGDWSWTFTKIQSRV